MHTDTAEAMFVTATVPEVDGFGWTTFGAVERRGISCTADTTVGELTTVDITKTSRSRASRVLLQTVR